MIADKLLQSRYIEYAERLLELGKKELNRTKNQPEFNRLAEMYCEMHKSNLEDFNELYRQNILTGFRSLEDSGHLVLITTAATHAFLPLFQEYPQVVNAQVELAITSHISHFRKKPKGFWLPECGFYPGLENILAAYDIDYFFTASHSLILADEKVERGVFAPVNCDHNISAFARDYGLSQAVWSEDDGYPVDRVYREFYRDIGFDLDIDYLQPFLHEPEVRSFTGFKYWAITSKSDNKAVYDPNLAEKRVKEHASNFIYMIKRKTQSLSNLLDRPPFFSIPFDAELFGHWWFEGI